MERPVERAVFERQRPRPIAGPRGRVLELGINTGKNVPYLPAPEELEPVAIDPSQAMLERARRHSQKPGREVELVRGDAQHLPFADANVVFCAVPDPLAGLREPYRVLKPGASLRLLKRRHPAARCIAPPFDLANPPVVRVADANINRHTARKVAQAGSRITNNKHLDRAGILHLIDARRPDQHEIQPNNPHGGHQRAALPSSQRRSPAAVGRPKLNQACRPPR